MSVKYVCYAVTIAVFYDFFCRWHSMMNWPCYNKFFGNVIRVIFTQWKHLEPSVNVSNWYCFKAVKRYICHYLMKSVSIPRNQSFYEIFSCLMHGDITKLVILSHYKWIRTHNHFVLKLTFYYVNCPTEYEFTLKRVCDMIGTYSQFSDIIF